MITGYASTAISLIKIVAWPKRALFGSRAGMHSPSVAIRRGEPARFAWLSALELAVSTASRARLAVGCARGAHRFIPQIPHGATWGEPLVLTGADIQVDLGYPSTVELDDGTLLSACYEWQPQTRHAAIRQITWKLPQQNAASKK